MRHAARQEVKRFGLGQTLNERLLVLDGQEHGELVGSTLRALAFLESVEGRKLKRGGGGIGKCDEL